MKIRILSKIAFVRRGYRLATSTRVRTQGLIMKYLIDTCVISELIKKCPDKKVVLFSGYDDSTVTDSLRFPPWRARTGKMIDETSTLD